MKSIAGVPLGVMETENPAPNDAALTAAPSRLPNCPDDQMYVFTPLVRVAPVDLSFPIGAPAWNRRTLFSMMVLLPSTRTSTVKVIELIVSPVRLNEKFVPSRNSVVQGESWPLTSETLPSSSRILLGVVHATVPTVESLAAVPGRFGPSILTSFASWFL